jgi:hypothetical protein
MRSTIFIQRIRWSKKFDKVGLYQKIVRSSLEYQPEPVAVWPILQVMYLQRDFYGATTLAQMTRLPVDKKTTVFNRGQMNKIHP